MAKFTDLEIAALRSLFSEAPEITSLLEQQLSVATVTERENSGRGFFTTLSVPATVAPVERSDPLSGETFARIPGLEHGLGFALFFEGGRIETLEGFAYGPESTASLDLMNGAFEVLKMPINRSANVR